MPESDDTRHSSILVIEQELNRFGRQLGSLQRKRRSINQRKIERYVRADQIFNPAIEALDQEIDLLLDKIIKTAIAHKDELTSTQSIRLNALDIEWRTDGKGTLIFTASEDSIITKLERLKGGREYVAAKKTVRKDPLKADAVTMAKLGDMAKIEYHDTITVTTKPSPAQEKRGAKRIKRERRL